jgi:spore germination protein GerM
LKDSGVLDRLFGGGELPQTVEVPARRDVPQAPRDNLVDSLLPETDPFLDLPVEEEIPDEAPVEPPQPSREWPLYFMQLDQDGTIVRTRVTRGLPASPSPMTDVLKALLQGPAVEEQGKGLISLIPPGSRLLSVTIRGETAYISLSEEFQFNTYGAEGYAAALRQIVWSVTEFSNIKDVQILIEGRRIDYLGEGIWIGSPVSRESV